MWLVPIRLVVGLLAVQTTCCAAIPPPTSVISPRPHTVQDSANQTGIALFRSTNKQSMNPRILSFLHFPTKRLLTAFRRVSFSPSALVSLCRYGLAAFLAIEIFRSLRSLREEWQDADWEMGRQDESLRSHNPLLTPEKARQVSDWLERPSGERGATPTSVPPWLLSLAQDLRLAGHGLRRDEYLRILLQLSKEQAQLLHTCMLRPTQRTTFRTIGGLASVKASIQAWISDNYRSKREENGSPYDKFVRQGLQGIVLWGAPGCGKSSLIQAIAGEAGLPTLVVTPSLIQRKWYGESTRMVRSLFGLISVMGPCVVVLDELDGLFQVRGQDEHEASRVLKTEWMQWWEGVASSQLSKTDPVLVVGATNRPWEVDPAIWRRLPQRYYVGVPNFNDRCDLWRRWCEAHDLPAIQPSILQYMAENTEGYIASDLFQVLQTACRIGPLSRNQDGLIHQLTTEDVQQALLSVPPTRFPQQYIQHLQSFLAPRREQPQTQNEFKSEGGSRDPQIWRTPLGNFYKVNIPVDSQVLDALEDFWRNQEDWGASDEEDSSDESSDDH